MKLKINGKNVVVRFAVVCVRRAKAVEKWKEGKTKKN